MKTHFTSTALFTVIAFVCLFDSGECQTNIHETKIQETNCEKKWWWWFYDCPAISTATPEDGKEQSNGTEHLSSDSYIPQNETNVIVDDNGTPKQNKTDNCNQNDCWDSPDCNQQVQYHWQDGGDNGRVQWARHCDFAGHDIDKKLSSAEECGGICIDNINCTHFTWGIGSYCYLKSAPKDADIVYPFPGAVCGYITRRDPDFQWQDGNNGLLNWAHGCDFHGKDIRHVKSRGEDCGGLCIADSKCTHFSWGWEGNCYLKTATKNAVANAITYNGICGYVNARLIDGKNMDWKEGKNGGFLWQENCDFVSGNVQDIVVVYSAKDDCGIRCQEQSECSHFTWNGRCILKKAPASENPSKLNGAICGKLMKNSIEGIINWNEGKNGGFIWQDNCDFVSGNVQEIVVVDSAMDDCGIKCQERSECSHFTWNGKCIMKRAPASEHFSYLQNAICGKLKKYTAKGWKLSKDGSFVWDENCDFVSGNVENIIVVDNDQDECGLKCRQQSGCTHFTWNGKCVLKKAPASEKFACLHNAICGKLINI